MCYFNIVIVHFEKDDFEKDFSFYVLEELEGLWA
jgi:hypothetical protein